MKIRACMIEKVFLDALVGLTLGEAFERCANEGLKCRVQSIDGAEQLTTADIRTDRVNICVSDNVVRSAHPG